MKILQINSVCGFGSTGRTTEELAKYLSNNGHESYVAYAHGDTSYPKSKKYGAWLEKKYHALHFRLFGQQGLASQYGTIQLTNYINKIKPDVVHLRNLHGNHINFPILFSFLSLRNYPIVWTLHDCWAFTGVCFHYTAIDCFKWKSECNSVCPKYKAWLPNFGKDRVKDIFDLKKQYFTSINKMYVVPVSKWLEKEVKQSYLAKYPIKCIYNWVDNTKFKPINENISLKYEIPKNKDIVLGVSAKWKQSSSKYKDAMDLHKRLPSDFVLVMIGALERGTSFPESVVHIPYLNNTIDLAKIYSNVMVYVHLSVEDTFGKVVIEAMACGTPVIVYNSTALPELIGEDCGNIVESHDIDELLKIISKIKIHGKLHYSKKCIARVAKNFNSELNMNKYLELYKTLIK